MNEKNYEYLINQLKHTGFGDTLNDDLRKNLETQNPEFTLNLQKEFGSDKVSADLHFKKSDQFEMYFFNKYDLQLKKQGGDQALKQTFDNHKGITLKEGYNLLDGRPVNKMQLTKEGEKYNAWLQLDFTKNTESGNYQFKQFHQNYGFDLEKTLSKYPIKELNNEKFKTDLIRSLERGNLQSATLELNGKEQKVYLTPNIAFKSLNAFDANMQKIKLSDLTQNQKQEQSIKQDVNQEVVQKQGSTKKQITKKETKIAGDKDKPDQKKSKRQKVA